MAMNSMNVNIVRDNEIQCEAEIDGRLPVQKEILRLVCEEQNDGYRWTGFYLTFSSKEWQPEKFSNIVMKKEVKKDAPPMKAMKTMKNDGKTRQAMKAMKAMKKGGQPMKAMKGKPMKAMKGKPMKAMK